MASEQTNINMSPLTNHPDLDQLDHDLFLSHDTLSALSEPQTLVDEIVQPALPTCSEPTNFAHSAQALPSQYCPTSLGPAPHFFNIPHLPMDNNNTNLMSAVQQNKISQNVNTADIVPRNTLQPCPAVIIPSNFVANPSAHVLAAHPLYTQYPTLLNPLPGFGHQQLPSMPDCYIDQAALKQTSNPNYRNMPNVTSLVAPASFQQNPSSLQAADGDSLFGDGSEFENQSRSGKKKLRVEHIIQKSQKHGRQKKGGKSRTAVRCAKCPEMFENRVNAERHCRGSHGKIRHLFPCEHCSASYESKGARTVHVKKAHGETLAKEEVMADELGILMGRKAFHCKHEGCKKSYSAASNLRRHFEMDHLKKRYPCAHCKYAATTKSNLKVHVSRMHHSAL